MSAGTPINTQMIIVSKCVLAEEGPTHLCLISVNLCVVGVMSTELLKACVSLGIPLGSSPSEIRAAYRSLVRAHHHAHGARGTKETTERLAEINAAKDLLDRLSPEPQTRPHRQTQMAEQAETAQAEPLNPRDIRGRREAEARAVRKANEARTDTHQATVRYSRTSRNVGANTSRYARNGVDVDAMEEESRRRREAFAAAISADAGRRSIFNRIKFPGVR